MATIIQDDLARIGVEVQIVPLETRALLARVFESYEYEACVLALAGGDVDPNTEMNLLLSDGPTHLWSLSPGRPTTPWQREIDDLMRQQLITLDPAERKRLYDRVQALMAENLPLIPLVSPNILVGAKQGLLDFRPAILRHYTLWNAHELRWATSR